MATISYPAHGWLPPGTVMVKERSDQGEDMVLKPNLVQAPGNWHCTEVRSDAPFPNGFGADFPLLRITSGPFAHPMPYYCGHCTTLVRVGDSGHFGHPVARADQGHPSQIGISVPGDGGWIELGQEMPNGRLGPDSPNGHWYRPLLMTPLIVTTVDPVLKWGDASWRVFGMSWNLVKCGYLPRPYFHFGLPVHGAVVAFKKHHKLPIPKPDGGIVDAHTDVLLQAAAKWCSQHHRKEV